MSATRVTPRAANAWSVVGVLISLCAVATLVGPAATASSQEPHVRIEVRGGDDRWHPLEEHLPLSTTGRVGNPVVTGTIAPFQVALPESFYPPALAGLEQVLITYPERSAGSVERVSPAILLVLEHAPAASHTTVYSVQTTPARGEPGKRLLSTSVLMGKPLADTVRHVATLAGIGDRRGRVFGGVAVFTPGAGRRIYLVELKDH